MLTHLQLYCTRYVSLVGVRLFQSCVVWKLSHFGTVNLTFFYDVSRRIIPRTIKRPQARKPRKKIKFIKFFTFELIISQNHHKLQLNYCHAIIKQ